MNTLRVSAVAAMGEDGAYRWFLRARWRDGVPVCLACGVVGATAVRRWRFRCRETACRREFSVTSGTILANRKLRFRTLVLALALSVHSVKGKAAAQLKRELGVDYKTAFVLLHKLREAVARLRRDMTLDGVVEMDGMYVGVTCARRTARTGAWPRTRPQSAWPSWRCASAAGGTGPWPPRPRSAAT